MSKSTIKPTRIFYFHHMGKMEHVQHIEKGDPPYMLFCNIYDLSNVLLLLLLTSFFSWIFSASSCNFA